MKPIGIFAEREGKKTAFFVREARIFAPRSVDLTARL